MNQCFVLMPFKGEFDIIYNIIKKASEDENVFCFRADKKKDLGLISQSIIKDILLADIVIADISELNPNVLYELGVAHVLNKPTILLSQELAQTGRLPFDISHMTTIPYTLPERKNDKNANKLNKAIRRYLNARTINLNPVSMALIAEKINIANHFGYKFLWGYEKTLIESSVAKEAWVVSSRFFWERLDNFYYEEIIEKRILTGQRKELVILPDTRDNRDKKSNFLKKYLAIYPNIEDSLRIIFLDNDLPLYFLSTEITIYDANTPNVRAIILEPMVLEGVDETNDLDIATAIKDNDPYHKKLFNLRENTFDLVLPKTAAERAVANFKAIWNEQCIKIEKVQWTI